MKLFYTKNSTERSSIQRFDPLVRRPEQRISGTRKSIMNFISATPGMNEIEIAQWLGLSKQNAHYHIRELEQAGVITVQREWKNARCYMVHKKNNENSTTKTMNMGEGIP